MLREESMFKVALSCAVAASGVLLYAGAASSRTMVVDETRGRYVECYNKKYVPARVLVNTRGRRVRGEYHEWEIHPTKWNRVREPAVYIQTRRTIEPDHYTLIRTSVCP
jgi:hypothetical protein